MRMLGQLASDIILDDWDFPELASDDYENFITDIITNSSTY